ncbi:MAG: 2-amino-4-hydroxy-6-hydroxymethyldihydropteridine diphosphokinase [Gemmatimonadota bacterium]
MRTQTDAGGVDRHSSRAYLGLGGNVGDVRASIRHALAALESVEVHVVARSADYRTPPWGKTDQPPFINACAIVCTTCTPPELLARCHEVEHRLGRVRHIRWGPRVIDIDLLVYEGQEIESEQLALPHPQMLQRSFVLVPLAEIAPSLIVGGTRIDDALAVLDCSGILRLDDEGESVQHIDDAPGRPTLRRRSYAASTSPPSFATGVPADADPSST